MMNKISPHVHSVTALDIPQFLPLVREYWRFEGIEGFDSERLTQLFARLLSNPHLGCAWIAQDDRAVPVGYLLAVYVFSLEYQGLTAEIDEFFVLPEQRSRGIGVALLNTAESAFVTAGCTKIHLQLGRGNAAARAFYGRHGYVARNGYELYDKTPAGEKSSPQRAGGASVP